MDVLALYLMLKFWVNVIVEVKVLELQNFVLEDSWENLEILFYPMLVRSL